MNSAVNIEVDWDAVEWVILDMDGTLLDLAYDNYFWRDLLPQRYAEKHGLTLARAREALAPKFIAVEHTLPWYCTDYWSEITGLGIAQLKREIRDRIRVLPGAEDFLQAVRASGRPLWLATNAHRDSWQLKIEHTGLGHYFDRIVSSHDFGHPKEAQAFWHALRDGRPFDPQRALFVDDSALVLAAARTFGIGQVVGLRQPDSGAAERDLPGFVTARTIGELSRPAARLASASIAD